MAVTALLVAGVICLVVGLALSSTLWLSASIAASVVVGLLLAIAARRRRGSRPEDRAIPFDDVRQALRDPAPTDQPGHSSAEETSPAATDAAPSPPALRTPAPEHDATQVWVVDGRPRYHRDGCDFLVTLPAEQISLTQAVEDGFVPCSMCSPPSAR